MNTTFYAPTGAATQVVTHILLVEDDRLTADLLRFVFERQGWQVTQVADGQAAQALLQGPAGFDAVVLDLLLPQLGGLALLAWLRGQPALGALPVLVLSALDGDEVPVQAFDAGASDFVRKPFNPDELLARLRRLLPGYRPGPRAERQWTAPVADLHSDLSAPARGNSHGPS